MRQAILGLLMGLLVASAQGGSVYDTTPEIIDTTFQRSDYFTPAEPWAVSVDDFLRDTDRNVPVVVHAHGCYGVYLDDSALSAFYSKQGANVVMLNFLKVDGRQRSCEWYPDPDGWPETANPRRIELRRMEMESQIQWLKDKGFKRIYVSGHSEGGRTVQGVKSEVAGVFVHGMDCKISRMEFWEPNPKNKIMVFLSSKDPWLGYPKYAIRGCGSLFNDRVQDYWSSHPTHSPLIEQEWRNAISQVLKTDLPRDSQKSE